MCKKRKEFHEYQNQPQCPCLCGSGKKFKHCCDKKNDEYLRYRKKEGELQFVLSEWAQHHYGADCREQAWRAFKKYTIKDVATREEMSSIFDYWFLYNWRPPKSKTVAESFIDEHRSAIPNDVMEFIHNVCGSPFSFYEAISVKSGQEITVNDLLSGKKMTVTEFSASKTIEAGHILFSRIVSLGSVNIFMGVGPFPLTSRYKLSIISLRQTIEQEIGKMHDFICSELFDTLVTKYFKLVHQATQPPKIKNTSGHTLKLHNITYSHQSPGELLDRLITLNPSPEEVMEEAERDEQGRLIKVVIPWMSSRSGKDNNTVLGYLEISSNQLSVEVNSSERARRIRGIIERRAGELVHLANEQITDIKELMKTDYSETDHAPIENNAPTDDYEANAVVDSYLDEHWNKWIHIPLPALNGQTPTQAVKTKNGRELVAELLDWMEKTEKEHKTGSQLKYIHRVRKQLKLK